MKLDDEQESTNVEDRRVGGSSRGVGKTGLGIGTVVVALIASYFLGIDPRTLLGAAETVQSGQQQSSAAAPIDPVNDPDHLLKVEVAKILNKTVNTWTALIEQMGAQYQKPKMVLFTGSAPAACGTGQAAMGPFYCPGDKKVFSDMGFLVKRRAAFVPMSISISHLPI